MKKKNKEVEDDLIFRSITHESAAVQAKAQSLESYEFNVYLDKFIEEKKNNAKLELLSDFILWLRRCDPSTIFDLSEWIEHTLDEIGSYEKEV